MLGLGETKKEASHTGEEINPVKVDTLCLFA
jgi:hypothetical protein